MEYKYFKQEKPFIVPTTDGKIIKEHFGLASTNDKNFSFAHMIAPAGWSEPPQIPEFDELTFIIRGKKKVLVDDKETIILKAGESCHIKKGSKVQYSNPFDSEVEYVSVCIPAFSIDLVHREEN